MSNRLTFSLASLIFLIALGLVFVPTAVMAHDAILSAGATAAATDDIRPHDHPLTAEIPAITGSTPATNDRPVVPAHGLHPVPMIKLMEVDNMAKGDEIIVTDETTGTTDVFTVNITFNMPVSGTDANQSEPAVPTLAAANFIVTVFDEDGTPLPNADASAAIAAGTAPSDAGDPIPMTVTVGTNGLPDADGMHTIKIRFVGGSAGVFGLQTSTTGPDGVSQVNIPGAAPNYSAIVTYKLVTAFTEAPDTKPPTVVITPPTMLDTMSKAVFRLTFSEPLAKTGLGELTVSDIEITGGTAMEADLSAPTAGTGGDAGKEIYTLKVTPTNVNASVTIALRADSVTDANGVVLVAPATDGSTMKTYDKTAPTVMITQPAAPDADGNLTFTFVFSEPIMGFESNDIRGSGFSVVASVPMKMASTDTTTMTETWTVKVTPESADTAVTVAINAGAVNDMNGNPLAVGMTKKYTPAATTPGAVDTGPPAATGQLGSKKYLVLVPDNYDMRALPAGLPVNDVPVTNAAGVNQFPDLSKFFSDGGTIDVVVTGKAKHNVIITEIMIAKDLGKRGVGTPEASQWIEIYNNTDAHINISDIKVTFDDTGFPAPALPTDSTDRLSNVVSGSGWGLVATFPDAVSGQTSTNTETRVVTVTKMFKSLRRKYKDDKALQDLTAADQILDGSLSSSWALTADSRVYLAGRIGTPGAENRPTVFNPAVYVAPDMSVTFNEIANLADDTNEWIELKGPADTNMRKYKIEIVTGYNKDTNEGTVDTIFQFPDNDDIKIPSTGILLLTDKSPVENKLEADLEDGVEKPVRYRIKELKALPNDKDFLLVLRNKDGKILDVAGYLDGLDDNDPYTLMWPLAANVGAAKPGRISALNKLASGNVYKRARAIQGYLANKDDGKEPAFEGAGFTGTGYDRNVSPGNKEHHGTPGYENGIQIGAGMEATDNVVISEVMYGDGTHSLPQWIEIQNRSTTKGVDLHNWKLYVVNHSMNADGSAFTGKVVDGIFLRNMKIPPRQTALVVSKAGQNRTSLPPHRVLNLKRKGNDALLSSKGFYLFLVANAHEGDLAKRQAGDTAGNLMAPAETVAGDNIKLFNDAISTLRAFQGTAPVWELPAGVNDNDYRVSVARKGSPKILNPDGTAKFHWVSSADDKRSYNLGTSYGRLTDIGSPGNTPGAALPVSLSKFRPERLKDTGEIVVRWVTESELNNAGFNILRSEKRDTDFTKVHFEAGEGTTSERTVYEWKDTTAKPNVVYYYQIQDVSLDGEVTTLRTTHLRGNVTAAGKATTTWGEIKALQ